MAKKLDADDAKLIRQLYVEGLTMAAIGAKFDISATHVWRIVHGEQHGEHGNCPFCGQRLPDQEGADRG